MKVLGASDLIKISGKSDFDQLTKTEIGLMIEAFLGDGNEFFDQLAFNEFLHAKLKNKDLRQIQDDLNRNSFLPAEGDEWPPINFAYLKSLASSLLELKGTE